MASDSSRLFCIHEELDSTADIKRTNTPVQTKRYPVSFGNKKQMDFPSLRFPRSTFDEGFSDDDDEDTLPPYPDVFEGTIFEDHEDFPTPVPAQIGVVRPLLGTIAPRQSRKDPFSETLDQVLKENHEKEQAVLAFTEKYDTLGRVRPKFELAKIPEGYINTNSLVRKSSSNQNTQAHNVDTNRNTSGFSRAVSELSPSFSEILQIHSPARTLSMSFEKQFPDIQSILSEDCTPKRGTYGNSWTTSTAPTAAAASTNDVLHPNPSRAILPVNMTSSLNRTSITPTNQQQLAKPNSSLSDHELLQVEMFYRSHKTQVFSSRCTADMYYGSAHSLTTSRADDFYASGLDSLSNWTLIKPGVPLVLLDSGESRRERKLYLKFAERGTGFALWQDQFNHLTNYQARDALVHTMHLSTDHSKLVAFKFHDPLGATDFLQKLQSITMNPDMDDILNLSKKKKKKKDKKKLMTKSKQKLPSKTAISAPCCFTHITTLDRNDGLDVLDTSKSTNT